MWSFLFYYNDAFCSSRMKTESVRELALKVVILLVRNTIRAPTLTFVLQKSTNSRITKVRRLIKNYISFKNYVLTN